MFADTSAALAGVLLLAVPGPETGQTGSCRSWAFAPAAARGPPPRLMRWLTCWKLAATITCAAAPGKWESSVRAAASSREILAAAETLASLVNENKVVIFSRGRSTATARVMNYFEELGIPYYALELENREDGAALQKALAVHTSGTFPLYANGCRKTLYATCLAMLSSVLTVRGIDSRLEGITSTRPFSSKGSTFKAEPPRLGRLTRPESLSTG